MPSATALNCQSIILREVQLPLRHPFVTSQGSEHLRRLIIIEAHSNGLIGYGESPPLSAPYYTEETPETVWYILEHFLIPLALSRTWQHPSEFAQAARSIRRHAMAKAGVEGALWDLHAAARGLSLSEAVGGVRSHVESGIVLGVERSLPVLLQRVEHSLERGYRRVKLKIEPGWDFTPLEAVRKAFGPIPLAVDANGSFTLNDAPALRRLDGLGLEMLEQPFSADDLLDHATLQAQIETPICLDESIESFDDARLAFELGSCRMINLKVARVGGMSEAKRIHDLCVQRETPVWVGGMVESGVGKLHSVALASLPGCNLPGDLPASSRHWYEDLVEPAIEIDPDGRIAVPRSTNERPRVDTERLDRYTTRLAHFDAPSANRG